MSLKQQLQNSRLPSRTDEVLSHAAEKVRKLRADMAQSFLQSRDAEDALEKGRLLARNRLEEIEQAVKLGMAEQIKKQMEATATLMPIPFGKAQPDYSSMSAYSHRAPKGVSKMKPSQSSQQLVRFQAKRKTEQLMESIVKNTHDGEQQRVDRPFPFEKGSFKPSQVTKIRREGIPTEIRKNPFAVLPILTKKDLDRGIYTLAIQGYLPKYIDITPALHRNDPLLNCKQVAPTQVHFMDSMLDLNMLQIIEADQELRHKKSVVDSKKGESVKPVELVSPQAHSPDVSGDNGTVSSVNQTANTQNKSRSVFQARKDNVLLTQPPLASQSTVEDTKGTYVRRTRIIEVVSGLLLKDEGYMRLRSANLASWGDIQEVIEKVIMAAGNKRIKTFKIDLDVAKAISSLMRTQTNSELLSCVVDFDKTAEFVKNCGIRLRSTQDEEDSFRKVAIKIQKIYRCRLARRLTEMLLSIKKKLLKIQFMLKLKYLHRETVKRSRTIFQDRYSKYLLLQSQFNKKWAEICEGPRVEVHISSLSRTMVTDRL